MVVHQPPFDKRAIMGQNGIPSKLYPYASDSTVFAAIRLIDQRNKFTRIIIISNENIWTKKKAATRTETAMWIHASNEQQNKKITTIKLRNICSDYGWGSILFATDRTIIQTRQSTIHSYIAYDDHLPWNRVCETHIYIYILYSLQVIARQMGI